MNPNLKRLIDRRLAKVSEKINKQWFYDFFQLFSKYNYDGNIKDVVEAMFNTEEIYRMEIDTPAILMNSVAAKKSNEKFMQYLNQKLESMNNGEVQEFFDDMVDYFEENIDPDIASSTCFIKYVTLKFSEDIKVSVDNEKRFETDSTKNQIHVNAKLGEFVLASLKAHKDKDTDVMYFDHMKTIKGLKRQHLGFMVMQEFFRFLQIRLPHLDACGMGVSKRNVVAHNFYAKLGGVFYTADTLEPVPLDRLKDPAYVSFGVYFDKNTIRRLAEAEFIRAVTLREHRERHYAREHQHHFSR